MGIALTHWSAHYGRRINAGVKTKDCIYSTDMLDVFLNSGGWIGCDHMDSKSMQPGATPGLSAIPFFACSQCCHNSCHLKAGGHKDA